MPRHMIKTKPGGLNRILLKVLQILHENRSKQNHYLPPHPEHG